MIRLTMKLITAAGIVAGLALSGIVVAQEAKLSPVERPTSDPRTAIKEQLYKDFYKAAPRVGQKAPGFRLRTTTGSTISLAEVLKTKPVVLEFGNSTCPPFRNRSTAIEELKRKWGDRVEFVIVYIRESNPDKGPFVGIKQPKSQEERDRLAQRFAEEFKRTSPVAVDSIDNTVLRAYGRPFNASFVIAKDGTVFYKEPWAPPARIDEELARMLGEKPASTTVAKAPGPATTTTLNLTGMSCQGCVIAVRNALLNVPGVESANVELSTRQANVKHSPSVKTADLIKAVKDTGFGAAPR